MFVIIIISPIAEPLLELMKRTTCSGTAAWGVMMTRAFPTLSGTLLSTIARLNVRSAAGE